MSATTTPAAHSLFKIKTSTTCPSTEQSSRSRASSSDRSHALSIKGGRLCVHC